MLRDLAVPNGIVTSRSVKTWVKTYWVSRHVETFLDKKKKIGRPRSGRELDVLMSLFFQFLRCLLCLFHFLPLRILPILEGVWMCGMCGMCELRFSSEIPGWGTRGSREHNEKNKERNAQPRRSWIYAKQTGMHFCSKESHDLESNCVWQSKCWDVCSGAVFRIGHWHVWPVWQRKRERTKERKQKDAERRRKTERQREIKSVRSTMFFKTDEKTRKLFLKNEKKEFFKCKMCRE